MNYSRSFIESENERLKKEKLELEQLEKELLKNKSVKTVDTIKPDNHNDIKSYTKLWTDTVTWVAVTIILITILVSVGINSRSKDNNYLSTSSSSGYSYTTIATSAYASNDYYRTCGSCSGTGRVTVHYGNSWNKKEGYGYGDVCKSCGGKGYITNSV